MSNLAHSIIKVETSDDDTDYDESHDEYKLLSPEVLNTHLNCTSETGIAIITVQKDVEVVEEVYKQHCNDLSHVYNNSKYFKKGRDIKQQDCESRTDERKRMKKAKMEHIDDEIIIISSDDDEKNDMVDTDRRVFPESDNVLTVSRQEATITIDTRDRLGSRDRDLLEKLNKVRRWKPTGLGTALLSGEKKSYPSDTKFRVLSYNILAQCNLTGHQNLYRGKAQYLLEWDFRWASIQREIQAWSPDVVTFQEVQFSGPDHFSEQIRPWFIQLGYEVVSQPRTGDKQDGCAIFFRKEKFTLVKYKSVLYRRDDVPLLNKDNIGLVCCLRSGSGAKLVVATTHLLFNPKRHEIRLAQTALLLSELDTIAWDKTRRSYVPVIITGDLNTQPFSDTYNLLLKGRVRYAGLQCGRSVLPMQLLPTSLGVTDTCQSVTELAERGVTPTMGTGEFSHSFGFRSVYNHSRHLDTRVPVGGYEATTFHSTWVTVDYIFYSTIVSNHAASNSKDGRQEGKLKLVGRLSLPTGPEISVIGGLPSSICPSDHLPLLAEFVLKA